MALVSGFKRSNLVEHVCDSFDGGIWKAGHLIERGETFRLLFFIWAWMFLGLLFIGVAPFCCLRSRRLAGDWFYFGFHFVAVSLGGLLWYVLPWEFIEKAEARHRYPDHTRPYL